MRASCFFKYSSNFSLAFFNPQTGSAECVSQCGCAPSSTASRPGNAAPRRTPRTNENETAAALPGFSFTQSFAFIIPEVAAAEARGACIPLPAILVADPAEPTA